MPTAIYCRVSSKGQAEDEDEEKKATRSGGSLRTQEAACRGYCEAHGLSVFRVYADTASVTAADGTEPTELHRPALDAMRDDVGAGLITDVVCHKWDRFAAGIAQTILVMELYKAGVSLHMCDGGKFDYESPVARGMMGFMGTVNEIRVELVREGTRRGRRGKATKGKVTLNGVAPYGYRLVGDKSSWLEVVPEEAEVVRRIFELYALPGSSSLTGVCNALLGTPTPSETGHAPAGFTKGHKRSPGVWNESSLRAILLNRLYGYGEWIYNRSEIRWTRDRVKTAPEYWVTVPGLPAIVTPELQQKAISRLEQNKRRRDGKRKAPYYLSGYLVCSECGLHWTGYATIYHGRAYRYYRCGGRQKKASLDGGETQRCTMRPLRAEKIENAIVEGVRDFMQRFSEGAAAGGVDLAAEWTADFNEETPTRDFAGELAKVEAKRTRLMSALDQTGAGKSAKAIGDKLHLLDIEEEAVRREQSAVGNTEGKRYTVGQVKEAWDKALGAFGPADLPLFMQMTGSVVEVKAPDRYNLALGRNLQSGVPVCISVKAVPIFLDRGKW